MLKIYDGSLDVTKIFNEWLVALSGSNNGAYIPFVGIVRAEDGIEALSFDIYEPILKEWFESWQQRAKKEGAMVMMAHSRGDVKVHTSSYIAAVVSPKRKVALKLINEFVEDFKANAPIWKYDVINSKRVYALDRSTPLSGSGVLK